MHHTANNYLDRRAMELGDQRLLSPSSSLSPSARKSTSTPKSSMISNGKVTNETTPKSKLEVKGEEGNAFLSTPNAKQDSPPSSPSSSSSSSSAAVNSVTPIPLLSPTTKSFLRREEQDHSFIKEDLSSLSPTLMSNMSSNTTRPDIEDTVSSLNQSQEHNDDSKTSNSENMDTSDTLSMVRTTSKDNTTNIVDDGLRSANESIVLEAVELKNNQEIKKLSRDHTKTKKLLRTLIQSLTPPPKSQTINELLSHQASLKKQGGGGDGGNDMGNIKEEQSDDDSFSPRKLVALKSLGDLFNKETSDDKSEEDLESDNEDEEQLCWNDALKSIPEPTRRRRSYMSGTIEVSGASLGHKDNDNMTGDGSDDDEDDEMTEKELETLCANIAMISSSQSVKGLLKDIISNPLEEQASSTLISSSTQTAPPIPPPPRFITSSSNTWESNDGGGGGGEILTSSLPPMFSSELLTNKNIPPGMFSVIVETVTQALSKRDEIHRDITRISLIQLQEKLDIEYKRKLTLLRSENMVTQQEFIEIEKSFTLEKQKFQKEKKELIETNKKLNQEMETLFNKSKNDREIANIALMASQKQTASFARALHDAENKIKRLNMTNAGIDFCGEENDVNNVSLEELEPLHFVDDDYYDNYVDEKDGEEEEEEATRSGENAAMSHGNNGRNNSNSSGLRKPRGYQDFAASHTPPARRSSIFAKTKYSQRTEQVIPSSRTTTGATKQAQRDENAMDDFFELRSSKFKAEEDKIDQLHDLKMNKIKHRGGNVSTTYQRDKLRSNKKNDDAFYDEEWGGYKLHSPLKGKKNTAVGGVVQQAMHKISSTNVAYYGKKVMKDISPMEFFVFIVAPLTFICLCILGLLVASTHSQRVLIH